MFSPRETRGKMTEALIHYTCIVVLTQRESMDSFMFVNPLLRELQMTIESNSFHLITIN